MTDSDEALVARSQSGQRAAFEELVRRTARLVYARLVLQSGDAHVAEDLSQEVFFTAWRSIGQLGDPAAFRGWLLAIAERAWLDEVRSRSRKKRRGIRRPEESLQSLSDPSPTPPEAAEGQEDRERLLAALRDLPRRYGEPLALRYLSGADYPAIARQLALTDGSLRGLLSRGMTMLREAMKSDEVRL